MDNVSNMHTHMYNIFAIKKSIKQSKNARNNTRYYSFGIENLCMGYCVRLDGTETKQTHQTKFINVCVNNTKFINVCVNNIQIHF